MKDVVDVEARFKEDGADASTGNRGGGTAPQPGGQPNMDSLKTWGWISYGLHLAVALAAVNIFGGFLVTRRMLEMFKKKERPAKAA